MTNMGVLSETAKMIIVYCLLVLFFAEYNSAYPTGDRETRDATFKDADSLTLEEKERLASINLAAATSDGGGIATWLIVVIIILVLIILVLVFVSIWLCIRCVFSDRVEDSLKRNHRFKTLRSLQKMRALKYEKETITMPELKIVHSSISAVTVTPEMENFPDPFNVKVYYSIEKQQKLGPFDGSDEKHELPVDNKKEPKRVTADAADPYGYSAQCSFAILEGPTVEPITNHSRTSASTATVRMVECTNFRSNTPVHIAYYDGEQSLGKFPAEGEHKLQNLKKTTKEIKVQATDELGNTAETTFIVDQKIPTVSYLSLCRTPSSITVKGVQLENFPKTENATLTFSCDEHQDHKTSISNSEHEVLGYGQSFQGIIVATATDVDKEYLGDCEICLEGPGPSIEPITNQSRTSISTATIQLDDCANFPAESQVEITYHDGEEFLGNFSGKGEHKLKNLKTTTKDVKVRATDDVGNIAESTFTIDQNIPAISYERVSRTPTAIVIKGVHFENFPSKESATVTYSCDGHQDHQAPCSSNDHTVPGFSQSWEGGIVKAMASDKDFTAECQICIEGPGPSVEPITNQSRTSISTATIRMVECKNFPADSQVHITYYDGKESLGRCPAGEEHKLTKLKKTTKEIKVQATDDFGNIAETTFTIDQNIPAISYESISRTIHSIFIKGVQLENFPDNANATVTYSCEGREDHEVSNSSTEHEIPGFRPSWEGKIVATATDVNKEYTAECQISIEALMETYRIYVTTSDKRGAGTDANVFIILYGENDDTGQKFLKKSSTNINKFERGETDEFDVNAVQVGEITKIKIGHDNKGGFAGWMLDKVEIEAPSLEKRMYFPCGRWLDKKEDDGQIERELPPVDRNTDIYHIYVTTSDVKGAGTDANVYINLYGEEENTGKKYLKSSKTHMNKFERGNTDEFEVEAFEIGDIKKIKIGHDNKGLAGAGWMLDRVEIEATSLGKRLQFPCDRWLDKDEDDGEIERELTPDDRPIVTYNISVTTSDVKGAGTDANVYIILYGENGDTGQKSLKSSKTHSNKFERGHTDEFEVRGPQVEAIKSIKIGHDNKGIGGAGWMLDRVEIEAPYLGKRMQFPCDRWLDKNEDDGEIERELTPDDRPIVTYNISVITSDVKGAGTDANVYIILYGENGDTGQKSLKSSTTHSNKFERANTDEFEVRGPQVDAIKSIKIGHDNKGIGGAGWMLDRVEIEAPYLGKRMQFPCDRWLDKNEDDGAIERELTPDDRPIETYNIFVTTSDVKGAGTDANVYIILYGENGDTGQKSLKSSTTHSNKFERGNTDEFEVRAPQVDAIKSIKIGHDNKGIGGAGWMLDRVEIEAPSLGKRMQFPCDRWLDKNEDDGQIERELTPDDRPVETYKIFVTTSDMKGAGTDANVYIMLYGENGDTGKKFLKSSKSHKNKFERGHTDEFEVQAPQVDEIKTVKIGHDNKGGFAGWMLDKVEIEAPSLSKRLYFPCGRWFDEKEDDGKIERELSPVERNLENYNIFVTTSDVKGAGTDANVYIVLYGENGNTGQQFLKKSKTHKDKFEQGNTDEFEVEADKVGEIKKIKIGHDNKGIGGAGWMLDRVEIEAPSLDKRLYFTCGRWLDKKEDDGEIERELTPVEHEMETYNIFVTTSDAKGAGTDANVYIILYGENGNTDKKFMKSSKTHKDAFEDGNTDEFEVSAALVGEIKNIKIGHDNKGGFSGWMLEKVEIEAPSLSKRLHFPCGRWLDKKEDDGQIERELSPVEPETYNIFVTTSDKKGAGTDANVYIILYGENGDTGKKFLKSSKTHKDKFERGNTDEFEVESTKVGEIKNIKIGHDNKGIGGSGWMLDNVEIEAPSLSKRLHFPCGRWLDKKEDDGKIERELTPGENNKPEIETYNIYVTTSDVKGAGTDANVYIILYGENGDTGQQFLKKSKTHRDKFESGNTDEFEVESAKLGQIKNIKIGHDNKGFGGAGWMLDRVEIEAPSLGKRLNFPCGRWLDKKEDDGQIERELFPEEKGAAGMGTDGKPPIETYSIFVTTSDAKGAGTDANVYIILYGENGDTGQKFLKKSKTRKDTFEQGKTDEFKVKTAQIGEIKTIKIGHDNKGGFAGWKLEKVEIEAPSLSKRLHFPCGRWLDKKEDDGQIERELSPVDKETYRVYVTTSDDRGAGTDANVYLIIYGESGKTDKMFLKTALNHKDKFEQGETDEFDVECTNVGKIKKIKIGHDNKGGFAGWKLDKVEIEAPSLSKRLHFPCGRWLDKKEDDKKIARELTPVDN